MNFLRLLLLFFALVGHAYSAEKSCFHFLEIFNSASNDKIAQEKADEVKKLVLMEWSVGKIAPRHFYSNEHMAALFQTMPKALQEVLIHADQLSYEERSIFFGRYYISTDKPLLWNELILYLAKTKVGWSELKLDPLRKIKVEQEIQEAIQMGHANYAYTNRYYATIAVDYQEKILKIGKASYPIKKKFFSNEWIAYVPKEKIVRPAWNPLESAKSALALEHRNRIHIYTNVSVGLNGKFYLTDGNHRFAFLEQRAIIPILINFDRTASLREFISHLGGTELSEQDILALYEGRKLPFDFFSTLTRDELVVEEKDLVK